MVCRKTNSQEFHKGAWERFDSGDTYKIIRIYCTNQTPATEWTALEKDRHIQSGHGLSRFNVKDSDGQPPPPHTFHRFSLAFLNQCPQHGAHNGLYIQANPRGRKTRHPGERLNQIPSFFGSLTALVQVEYSSKTCLQVWVQKQALIEKKKKRKKEQHTY